MIQILFIKKNLESIFIMRTWIRDDPGSSPGAGILEFDDLVRRPIR